MWKLWCLYDSCTQQCRAQQLPVPAAPAGDGADDDDDNDDAVIARDMSNLWQFSTLMLV